MKKENKRTALICLLPSSPLGEPKARRTCPWIAANPEGLDGGSAKITGISAKLVAGSVRDVFFQGERSKRRFSLLPSAPYSHKHTPQGLPRADDAIGKYESLARKRKEKLPFYQARRQKWILSYYLLPRIRIDAGAKAPRQAGIRKAVDRKDRSVRREWSKIEPRRAALS